MNEDLVAFIEKRRKELLCYIVQTELDGKLPKAEFIDEYYILTNKLQKCFRCFKETTNVNMKPFSLSIKSKIEQMNKDKKTKDNELEYNCLLSLYRELNHIDNYKGDD